MEEHPNNILQQLQGDVDTVGLKPSLMNRMFNGLFNRPSKHVMETSLSTPLNISNNESTLIQSGGGLKIKGGASEIFPAVFLSKAFLHYFVFVISIIVTFQFMAMMIQSGEDQEESQFTAFVKNNKGGVYVYVLILIFILMLAQCLVYGGFYVLLLVYVSMVADDTNVVPKITKDLFMEIFWFVSSKSGESNMMLYIVIMVIATVIFMLVLYIYLFFNKGYYAGIRYYANVNDSDSEKKEYDDVEKFTLRIMYIMCTVVMFCFMMFCFHFINKESAGKRVLVFLLFYTTIVFVLLIFTGAIFSSVLKKKVLTIMMLLLSMFIIVMGYAVYENVLGYALKKVQLI